MHRALDRLLAATTDVPDRLADLPWPHDRETYRRVLHSRRDRLAR